jgi:hypothetical protein
VQKAPADTPDNSFSILPIRQATRVIVSQNDREKLE